MNIKTLVIGFLAALLAPALALAAQVTVSLSSNSISPSTVSINVGDTVVWDNTSGTTQSVTADNGSFQSSSIAPGGQFAATFNTGGTYNYYDNAGGYAVLGTIVVNGTPITTPITTYVNPSPIIPTTSVSNSSTLASLESELQSLVAEIDAIEGNTTASTGVSGTPSYAPGSCPEIGRVLSLGDSGSDVASLQEFLGVSPVTSYYGTQTQTAVEEWQAANNIISYGTPSTTGYGVVGPRTAAAMRLACSGGSSSASSAGNVSGTAGGFLQVTPISGSAPLVVSVTATVNAGGSCAATAYTLDFGDNSPQQVIQTSGCSPASQTFQHTYQYAGTYTVTLSAGTHSSSATVYVSGQTAPSYGSSSTPTGSISAVVSSGNAPFNATFYVSCTSGEAYDVNFGDGTDLGSSGVSQSTCNGSLQAITHTYKSAGSYEAQLIVFVQSSNGTFSQETLDSQTISVNAIAPAASTYAAPTLTPDANGNPLEVSLSYSYDSSGCETSINWGDGQTTGPSGCTTFTGVLQTFTQTHTYSGAGTYSITLTRDSQTNTVGVTIQ